MTEQVIVSVTLSACILKVFVSNLDGRRTILNEILDVSEFLPADPEARVRFPALPERKKVVGLERGALSLVSTTEELLDKKSSGSCLENREYGRRDPSR
jgi:hypothetical protein